MPAPRGMELRTRWLAVAALAAACVRAPQIPPALDPSNADAPEGSPPPARPGPADSPEPPPDGHEEHEAHTQPPDHEHGGHSPEEDAPR